MEKQVFSHSKVIFVKHSHIKIQVCQLLGLAEVNLRSILICAIVHNGCLQ